MTRIPGHAASDAPAPPRHAGATRDPAAEWIGLGEASRMLGISQGTLRRWADDGRVGVFTTPGGHRRFSRTALRRLLPAPRAQRPSLARLGASPGRIVRAYRPARPRRVPDSAPPWLGGLGEQDRLAFRERGRGLVSALLEHLDASDASVRAARLQEASRLAGEHGRCVAQLGASMAEAVETFLQFRRPFIEELVAVSRRRGLDVREATELLVQAEDAMDRLLVATMTGHSLATGAARRKARPA